VKYLTITECEVILRLRTTQSSHSQNREILRTTRSSHSQNREILGTWTTFSWADLVGSEGVPELQYGTRTCMFLLINGNQPWCRFGSEIMPLMYLWCNLRSLSTSHLT